MSTCKECRYFFPWDAKDLPEKGTGNCQRFPEYALRHESNWCGEFAPDVAQSEGAKYIYFGVFVGMDPKGLFAYLDHAQAWMKENYPHGVVHKISLAPEALIPIES